MPAAVATIAYGESGTAKLLILSQVVLGLQLPFAIVPLLALTASRAKMGPLRSPRWLTAFAIVVAVAIVVLNIKVVVDFARG